jgi:hypothetical protein
MQLILLLPLNISAQELQNKCSSVYSRYLFNFCRLYLLELILFSHIFFKSFWSPQYQYTGRLLYVEIENLLLLYLLFLIIYGCGVDICLNDIYILSLLYLLLDVLLPGMLPTFLPYDKYTNHAIMFPVIILVCFPKISEIVCILDEIW